VTTPQNKSNKKTSSVEMAVLAILAVVFLVVSLLAQFIVKDADGHYYFTTGADLRGSLGVILAAGLTLVMYSFLYRDNALFKIAENLYVGVALGYMVITITWREALRPEVYDKFFNAPTWGAFREALLYRSVPVILGVLLITRLSRKHGWISRYSYALIIGYGAGVGIPLTTHSFILKQLYAGVAPLQDAIVGKTSPALFSWPWFADVAYPVFLTALVVVGTVAVLFYFFYSIEHKRTGRTFSQVGIFFLMVSFGASFGYTVMGRVSLLIGRVQFLLYEWLKIPK